MAEYTTNTLVGITHVWPHNKFFNLEAQPFSIEREADVWKELRDLTFDDDVRGAIAVVTHTTYQDDRDAFLYQLKKDDVVLSRVKFFPSRDVELQIHVLQLKPSLINPFVVLLKRNYRTHQSPSWLPLSLPTLKHVKKIFPFI